MLIRSMRSVGFMRSVGSLGSVKKIVRQQPRDQRGLVIVYFALTLVVLMISSAFVVDIGSWYARSQQLQRAADAAAMAGVTYMPTDFNKAQTVALAAAAKNGIDPAANPDLSVTVSADPNSAQRLDVTVTDANLPRYFSQTFASGPVHQTRRAVAEYLPAVPLGSPENTFGLGTFGTDTVAPNIWAAVTGWCTPKEAGDQYSSKYDAEYINGVMQCGGSGTVTNADYDGLGYHGYIYDVAVPSGRGSNMILEAYDPAFVPYWYPVGSGVRTTCSGTAEGSPDFAYAGNTYRITTHFDVLNPDGSLLTPNSFASQENGPFTSQHGDSADCGQWKQLASIPTSAAAGTYKIRVFTDALEPNSFGVNAFSLEARYSAELSPTRCSTVVGAGAPAPYSATCAQISAESAMTAYTNVDGSGATKISKFNLAPISTAYAGSTMTIKLWDPGDLGNANKIQVINPSGTAVAFSWSVSAPCGGVPLCSATVATSGLDTNGTTNMPPNPNLQGTAAFNDRLVTLSVPIPTNYAYPAASGGWWKLNYTYNSGTKAQDLTTWSVAVSGTPVHLING